MNLFFTITSYPPSVGGAQTHMHRIASRLATHHNVQVATHWRENRTDWLLGTTLRAPRNGGSYTIDDVPVQQITLTVAERLRLLPYVAGYYAAKGIAIDRISDVLLHKLVPLTDGVELVHNGRIGREGLSYASLKLARRLGVPFVFTPFHHPRWVGWNYKHYIRLYREADAVLALTQAEKGTLVDLGVQERRVHVVGMGPDLAANYDADAFRRKYVLSGPIILFVGQKYRYKGIRLLLEAAPRVWERHAEATFLFIGPRTKYSKRLFAAQTDHRIVELGSVSPEEKTSALATCDIFCMPSTQESFGAVYLEAWLMGAPVIGCDIPAVREVIHDGIDGYLISPEPTELADRIIDLLDHPARRTKMAEAGKAKVLREFTWDTVVARVERAYLAALGG